MKFLILFLFLISPVSAVQFNVPCDLPEEYELVQKDYAYIVRNYTSYHTTFNSMISPNVLMSALENTEVTTFEPFDLPRHHKKEAFKTIFTEHFLKYENMSLSDILKQDPLDTRVISLELNDKESIIQKMILDHFDCNDDDMRSYFFLGAKGQGFNFLMNTEQYIQTSFGKTMWLFPKKMDVLLQIGMGPQQTPAKHIEQLISSRTVEHCIADKNDVIYIPDGVAHGTFNLENSLNSACIKPKNMNALERRDRSSSQLSTEVCKQPTNPQQQKYPFMSKSKKQKEQPRLPMKAGKIVREANNTKVKITLTKNGFSHNIPCNFVEFEKPQQYHEPYILRNRSYNAAFNKAYTIKNLKNALKDHPFMSMQPLYAPIEYVKESFSKFIDEHVLKYDNMSLWEIVNRETLDTRMPFMRFNTTHPVLPDEMHELHNCSFAGEIAQTNSTTWDYFLSAKGQSVNFHAHNAIFTQVTKGKKLWLIPEDMDVLREIGVGERDTPALHIEKLINHPRVKTCVAEENDITYIPLKTLHGVFNLETTLAHGCIIFDSDEMMKNQMHFDRHANMWDL